MKLTVKLFLLTLALVAKPTFAADCASIKSQKERLTCYDKAAQEKPKKNPFEDTVEDLKRMATQNFFDPDSAKFRNLTGHGLKSDGTGSQMMVALCGEVNAKNRSGGYVGYKRFLATISDSISIEEPHEHPAIQKLNEEIYGPAGMCGGPILYKQP